MDVTEVLECQLRINPPSLLFLTEIPVSFLGRNTSKILFINQSSWTLQIRGIGILMACRETGSTAWEQRFLCRTRRRHGGSAEKVFGVPEVAVLDPANGDVHNVS